MKELSDIDMAYIAGIIDGEGSISSCARSQKGGGPAQYMISVHVGMCDDIIPRWLKEVFGGGYSRKQPKGNRKPVSHWIVSCNKAETFLKAVFPFLKVKKEHAKLAIYMCELKRKRNDSKSCFVPLSAHEKVVYIGLHEKMKSLNKKGREVA